MPQLLDGAKIEQEVYISWPLAAKMSVLAFGAVEKQPNTLREESKAHVFPVPQV
jgi:hypothetical protein